MYEFNRGVKYLNKCNGVKALVCFKKFLKDYPCKEVYLNIGNAYRMLENESLATSNYLLAASDGVPYLRGGYAPYAFAYNNIGLQEYNAGRMNSALDFYNAALTIDPEHVDAKWNKCVTLLKSSNCSLGWDMYNSRFNHGIGSVKRTYSLYDWDLISSGDAITVQAEQGLGDKIMFGRYISQLEAYFPKIYIMCAPVLDVFYKGYECVRAPASNCMIPMGSLVSKFGIIGCESAKERIDGIEKINRSGFNIAVCWAGSATHANNKYRSCPVSFMSGLSTFGNLYSLDPGGSCGKNIRALRPSSWKDTISLIKGMDLVVSVDTSIVHLAGTLGIPCLMVQPIKSSDYRWGMPGDTNRWYDSVKVIDNSGSWDETFDRVGKIIKCIR